MKIGVTGASGFIGRKLTKKLLDSGYDVRKFVRREPQSEDEIYWSPSKKEIDIEAGVDEVARGCLFGRVYTAAVVWPQQNDPDSVHPVMKDSKKFNPGWG